MVTKNKLEELTSIKIFSLGDIRPSELDGEDTILFTELIDIIYNDEYETSLDLQGYMIDLTKAVNVRVALVTIYKSTLLELNSDSTEVVTELNEAIDQLTNEIEMIYKLTSLNRVLVLDNYSLSKNLEISYYLDEDELIVYSQLLSATSAQLTTLESLIK